MDGWMDGWMVDEHDGWVDKWMDGTTLTEDMDRQFSVGGWMEGPMEIGWINWEVDFSIINRLGWKGSRRWMDFHQNILKELHIQYSNNNYDTETYFWSTQHTASDIKVRRETAPGILCCQFILSSASCHFSLFVIINLSFHIHKTRQQPFFVNCFQNKVSWGKISESRRWWLEESGICVVRTNNHAMVKNDNDFERLLVCFIFP